MTYVWEFGDGTEVTVNNVNYVTHAYTALGGPYEVRVTASNVATESSSEPYSVWIKESIGAVTVSSASSNALTTGASISLDIDISSGSDYTCIWDMGNSMTVETSSVQTPIGFTAGAVDFMYDAPGEYNVNVECDNGVSSETDSLVVNVYDVITNLRGNCTGALIGAEFVILFQLDSDIRDVTIDFTFDGTPMSMSSANQLLTSTIPGKPRGGYWIDAVATNPVSTESFRAEFLVESDFDDPSCFVTPQKIMHGAQVTVSVSTTRGSSLTVDVHYGDGTDLDRHYTGRLVAWDPGFTYSPVHAYRTPGIMEMTIIMYNGYRNFTKTYDIVVMNRVEGTDGNIKLI